MSILFYPMARLNPANREKPAAFYPAIQHTGRIDLERLANQAAALTVLNPVDVKAGLEALLQIIPQHLLDGKVVDLGSLGTFRLGIRGEGVATAEELEASHIIRTYPQFRYTVLFREQLQKATFVKIEESLDIEIR